MKSLSSLIVESFSEKQQPVNESIFDNKNKLRDFIKGEVHHDKHLEPIYHALDILFKNKNKITKVTTDSIKEKGENVPTIEIHTSTNNVKRVTQPDLFDSGKAKKSTNIILRFYNYNDESKNVMIDVLSDYKQDGKMVERFDIWGNKFKNELKELLK